VVVVSVSKCYTNTTSYLDDATKHKIDEGLINLFMKISFLNLSTSMSQLWYAFKSKLKDVSNIQTFLRTDRELLGSLLIVKQVKTEK
jgi:hypothetical protein